MQYLWPTVLLGIITVALFALMWRSWRRGKKIYLENGEAVAWADLKGEVLASFNRALYVSTNRAGQSLVRVQYPGLRYRGYADISVLSDGVRITVTGEEPVEIAAAQIEEADNVQMRIGKVVEKGGLAAIAWHTVNEKLESSFRFSDSNDQNRFIESINQIIEGK